MDQVIRRLSLTPAVLALALSFLISASALAQGLNHTGHTAAEHAGTDVFVVEMGPDGQPRCRHVEEPEAEALRPAPREPLNLTVVPSTNAPSEITGMRVLLRATDQLLEFPEALLAFRRAAARWERAISTPITIVIDVDYGLERFDSGPYPPNVLGSASGGLYYAVSGNAYASTAQVVDALKAQHPGDPQLQALYDGIPTPAPSTVTDAEGNPQTLGRAVGTRATLQALGFFPAATDPDPLVNAFGSVPNIGFNAAFPYDFEPADGIASGELDFEGVAVHEIGHSLGFTSRIGVSAAPTNEYSIWDLFRVRPGDVEPGEPLDDGEGWETAPRVLTPGPPNTEVLTVENGVTYYKPVQVFFDGLKELEVSTATGSRQGGDGQQASHWRDDALRPPSLGPDRKIGIMDPNLGTGSRDEYTDNDLRALEVIGYNVIYDPAFAAATFTVNGEAYDVTAPDSLSYLDLGDASLGGAVTMEVGLTNQSAGVDLAYSAEVAIDAGFPASVTPDLSLSAPDGLVAPGATANLTLSAGADAPSVFYGTLRIETNVDSVLVFDVPFRFSIAGATPPRIEVVTGGTEGEPLELGDFASEGARTLALFTAENEGNLPLEYRASVSTARVADPFPLDTDVTAGRPAGRTVVFEEDFEDGTLGGFVPGGSVPGDWRVIDVGPALLSGHSIPHAAYFGQQLSGSGGADSLQYQNNATGILISPSIELGDVPQEDLVVLSFNTFLQAEEGWDFATVFVSYDDGESYEEIATSDEGILRNTIEWERIEVGIPILPGELSPIRIAFQFVSDELITDLGWLIDDVVVERRENANPIYVTPVEGAIEGEGSEDFTLTIRGEAFERGYYRGTVQIISNALEFSDAGVPFGATEDGIRVVGLTETVPFTFTVGDPSPPTLSVAGGGPTVSVPANEEVNVEVEITNEGGADLSFVRVMEPALSRYTSGALPPEAPAPAEPARDSLAAIEVPGLSVAAAGIAQLADGRVVVADGGNNGRTYVLAEDLSAIEATLEGFVEGTESIGGLAFNEATGTLWFAVPQNGELVEATLEEGAVVPTGSTVDVSFLSGGPGGIAYSAELDAFFVTERNVSAIYAVDTSGTVLPGYPVEPTGRGGTAPGLVVTDGVLEVFNDNLSYVQYDQFGRLFEESEEVVVDRPRLGGSPRINGMVRSRSNPNGVVYYLPRASGGVAYVVAENPPDLPAYTRTPIEAAEPFFGFGLEPGATRSVALRVDGIDREPGVYTDTLAFLTNNPEDRVFRLPFEITVSPSTPLEGGSVLPTAFALHPSYPNPFADRATLRFDLPAAARASATVYNVLGQRVATLLDGEALEAGRHEVTVEARGLASGTYVVRLTAGAFAGSQRITVVR